MNDQDALLRRLTESDPHPVGGQDAAPSPSAQELLARIVASPAKARRSRVRRPIRWIAVPFALVIATLLAVQALPRGRETPASAAEVLRKTATVAASAPPASGGTYSYSKVDTTEVSTAESKDGPWSAILSSVQETWTAGDGSGRVLSDAQEPQFLGPRDMTRWQAAGSPEFATGLSDQTFGPGGLPVDAVAGLPTDPEALLSVLRDQVSSEALTTNVAIFVRIGEILALADASPELRAGLYRAAAELPGVELLGDVEDPSGRAGAGVGMSFEDQGTGLREVLVFDSQTSQLLAQEEVLLEQAPWIDAPVGAVISSTVYVSSGHVDSTNARPQSSG